MGRSLGLAIAVAGILLAPRPLRAFTMGEAVATTGVQNSLAATGTTNVAGTIGSAKRAAGAAAERKQEQLAAVDHSWGGKGGGKSSWAVNDPNNKSWGTNAAGKGWGEKQSGTGWASADAHGKGGWSAGSWND